MPAYTVIAYDQVTAQLQSLSVTERYNFFVKKYDKTLKDSQGIIVTNVNEQIPPHCINFFMIEFLPVVKAINDSYKMDLKPMVFMNLSILDSNIRRQYPSNLNQTLGSAFDIIELEPFRLYTYLQNNFNTGYSAQPIDRVSDSNKYLCKFGKLNKLHSLLIFALLKESGLLEEKHGLWSLAVEDSRDFNDHMKSLYSRIQDHENMHKRKRGYVKHIPRYDYSKYQRVLDRDFSNSFEYGESHYTGFPFDTSHYANTRYSIVRETNWTHNGINLFLSEKTWLPISMKHPFMLFSNTRVVKYLRDSGYVSPDNFQMSEISDLDNVTFSEAKEKFLENHNKILTTPKSEIQDMVEHNYDLFLKHARSDMDKLLSMPAEFLNLGDIFSQEMTGTFLDLLLMMHYPNRNQTPPNDNWDWQALRQYSPDK